jgi:hypothetical protein
VKVHQEISSTFIIDNDVDDDDDDNGELKNEKIKD